MASDFFIKLDGIDGESADKAHAKWIEVLGFSHGSVQTITIGRSTDVTGRGQFEPFVFTHLVDKATPKIQQYAMSGKNISKVNFHVCRAIGGAQTVVYEMTLENVKIGKAQVYADVPAAVDEPAALPRERVELVAAKITWKVTAIKPDNTKDGAVEASFNQVENA